MKKFTLLVILAACYGFMQAQGLSGDYYIPKGINLKGFASLYDAAQAITTNSLAGNVRLLIDGDLTETNNIGIVNTTAYTLTITPSADVNRTITFNNSATNPGPEGSIIIGVKNDLQWSSLTPTKNVIIDGTYNGGTIKRLSIITGSNQNPANGPISIVDNCTAITIKNCIITHTGLPSTTNNTSGAIHLRGVTDAGTQKMPSSITIDNNVITSNTNIYGKAIALEANNMANNATGTLTMTSKASGMNITNNLITAQLSGIRWNYTNGANYIKFNEFHINQTSGTLTASAFYANAGNDGYPSTTYIDKNKFIELKTASTGTGGVIAFALSTGQQYITNNFITGFNKTSTGTQKTILQGITVSSKVVAVNNTFFLNALTNKPTANSVNPASDGDPNYSAVSIKNYTTNSEFYNNIFISNEDEVPNFIYRYKGTSIGLGGTNNNIVFLRAGNINASFSQNATGIISKDFVSHQTNTSRDGTSKSVNVNFVSETTGDLHLAGNSLIDANLLYPKNTTYGVYTDIDEVSRNNNTQNGADQAAFVISSSLSNNSPYNVDNINQSLPEIYVANDGVLNINSGKSLTIPNYSYNNGTVNILSDATGTGTLLTPSAITGTGTYNVNQYLPASRNYYMASAVSGATLPPTGYTFYTYNEQNAVWNTITSAPANPMTGYIAKPGASNTITFTGTNLNNGAKTITGLTTTEGKGNGYNLVGNPYPSYVNWELATKTNLEPTMWYRTQNASSVYVFDTYSATTHLGTNNNGSGDVTKFIPPMQGFWVKVTTGTGGLSFDNSMRSHQDVTTNKFRVKAVDTQSVLRLKLSNGINNDETILVFNPTAQDTRDEYDSSKMSNNNAAIPEIYTILNGEKIVINGMNSIPADTEIPLGFTPGSESNFTLQANEVSNLPQGMAVILKDNAAGTETDLTSGNAYNFTNTGSADRFSIIFRSPGVATKSAEQTLDKSLNVYRNVSNRIMIQLNLQPEENAVAEVYNVGGGKITQKLLKTNVTELDVNKAGVYIVKVINGNYSATKKVVLK